MHLFSSLMANYKISNNNNIKKKKEEKEELNP
jgi:hypothetical protein